MIIIPELEIVVICTPKTGTTSLLSAVRKKYPKSLFPYRHMEASSVPIEYKDWKKVGVFRSPIERLWSLYKYAAIFQSDSPKVCKHYITGLNDSVKGLSFNEWIIKNEFCFTQPYDAKGKLSKKYLVENVIPENKKSQYLYLRPDLGTEIIHYENLYKLEKMLNLSLPRLNVTSSSKAPLLNDEAMLSLKSCMQWDLDFEEMKKLNE